MNMYMYVECVFSEIVSSALCFHDFVCMHLLLDQFFDDFLKFQKLKQPLICKDTSIDCCLKLCTCMCVSGEEKMKGRVWVRGWV